MAELQLTVKVIKTQLDELARQIKDIQSKNITLTINGNFTQSTKEATKELGNLDDKINVTIQRSESLRKEEHKTAQAFEKTKQKLSEEAKEYAKTNQEVVKLIKSKEATKQAEERTAQAHEKTSQAVEKTKQKALQYKMQQDKLKNSINETTKAHESFLASMLKARAITFVVSTITSQFKEALNTIREVDKELATIQKVTGYTKEQMAPISQAAYSTASKYGVEATQYLQSVAEFARAGYKDMADDLGELAIKTQLVGDTNAETADKFLLAVDAAWKMEGSVSALSAVLDKANIIENNYATTIDKIAAGMPNVASVAAMTNVSVEETIAALGTITAVTQQTGQKASTALRSLFLNIVGDTNTAFETETGEFVKWTSDEVEVLRGLLNKYAKDVVDTAKAAGEVINPMRAIEALAEAFDRGDLKANELEATLQQIGGKLRTNQLVALVENFDMVNEMLGKMGASAGSADKEIGVMLDTWDAKAKQLKNTWTEFVSKSLSPEIFKKFLDGLNGILKSVGSLGNALAILGTVIVALKLPKIADWINTIRDGLGKLSAYLDAFKNRGGKGGLFGMIASEMTGVEKLSAGILGVTAAIGIAIAAVNAYLNKLSEATSKAIEQSNASANEHKNILALTKQYEEAKEAYGNGTGSKEEYTAATERLAEALKYEGDIADLTTEKIKELTEEQRKSAITDADVAIAALSNETYWHTGLKYGEANRALSREGFYDSGLTSSERMQAAARAIERLTEQRDRLLASVKSGTASWRQEHVELSAVSESLDYLTEKFGSYEDLIKTISDLMGYGGARENGLSGAFKSARTEADDLADSIKTATSALKDFTDATETELDDTFKKYVDAYKQFLEDWEAGLKGSNAVRAAEELFFTDEQINELRAKGMDVGEILANDFYKGIFSAEGKDRGAVFLGQLWDHFGGDIISNGKLAASLSKTGDSISIVVEDVDALADALYNLTGIGFTPEFLDSWLSALGMYSSDINVSADALMNMATGFKAVSESGVVSLQGMLEGLQAQFGDNTSAIWDYIDALLAAADKGEIQVDLGADDVQAARDKIRDALNEVQQKEEDVTQQEATVEVSVEGYSEAVSLLDSLRLEAAKPIVQQIVLQSRGVIEHNANGTSSAAGGLSIVNERGPEIIAEGNQLRIAGGGKPTLTYLEPGATVLTAGQTKSALGGLDPAIFYGGIRAFAIGTNTMMADTGHISQARDAIKGTISGANAAALKAINDIKVAAKNTSSQPKSSTAKKYTVPVSSTNAASYGSSGKSSGGSGGSSGGSSGGGSSSSSKTDAQLEKLKEIVNLRKSELELIKAQDGTTKSQIEKQRQIQDALKNEINYLVSIGGNQTEINKLWTEWYKINDDIKDLIEDMFKELSDAADREIDALEKERDKALEPLDAQLKAMQEQRDAAQDQLDYEEKLLAVEQARQALENAKGERNVRYWNAAKGQWEWTYNAQNVASAQKSYDDAVKALADYEDQMAYDAAVKEIEAQKQAITDSYKAATDGWQEVIDALKEPTDDMETVLKRISESSMPEMEDTINTLNTLLARFGYAIGGYGGAYLNSSMLPTSITDAMISPISGSLAGSVGNVAYGATPYGFAGTTGSTSIGTQYNGGVYNIGGISLTEAQAKSTTVYELAMLSRNLKAYNATC